MKQVHIWLFITKLLFLPIMANSQEISEKIIIIDSVNKREKNLRPSFWDGFIKTIKNPI